MTEQIINEIQEKFAELKSAVMMREKLLLRQLEVINSTRKQQIRLGTGTGAGEQDIDTNINFLCDNEQELLAAIRNFGRYQLTNLNLGLHDVYLKNEDYIKPSDDHETMFKGLNHSAEGPALDENEDEECKESIVVDFSHHKTLMEHNAKIMNESIINITLKEAKELIKQAKMKREQPVPPLNLEELDDEVESSIAEVVSSLEQNSLEHSVEQLSNNKYSQTKHQQQSTKEKRFKPKITINNCNGTINLRNIASLTINCTTEDNVQAQIPVRYPNEKSENLEDQTEEEPASSSSSSASKVQKKSSQNSKTVVESLVSSSSNTECTSPTSTTNNTTPNSLSNYSSNNSSRSQSTKKQKSKKSYPKLEKSQTESQGSKPLKNSQSEAQDNFVESSSSSANNDVTCDFYNRLLNEIKKSINQQQKIRTKYVTTDSTSATTQQNADSSTSFNDFLRSGGGGEVPPPPSGRRLVLKNFENLKIILEANSGSGDEETFHPVQIEQWLAEIISETDLEPMQNTDILEHSKIHNEEIQET